MDRDKAGQDDRYPCPEGCKIETDSEVEIKASQAVKVTAPKVEITGQVTINGNLTVSGDMTAGGKPYLSHTHRGDSGGTTGAPL